jgi:hypothetical protein
MNRKINLNEWVKKFDNKEFVPNFTEVQISAGWFDWFCKDEVLGPKTKKLAIKLKQIMKSSKINCETSYVFFKNNCPVNGRLYDDFRICDIESGEVIYTITPSNGHTSSKGLSDVWGKENDFKEALVEGTWKDVKQFFEI